MNTVTLLHTRKDRLRALGVTPWAQYQPESESLHLLQAPSAAQWLFLLDAVPQGDDIWQTPTMTLFAGILRALNESPETVAWGMVKSAISTSVLSERFPNLKTVVLLGEQPARRFFKNANYRVPSTVPNWGDKFYMIMAPTLAQLQAQPEAKRWLWQQLQQVKK